MPWRERLRCTRQASTVPGKLTVLGATALHPTSKEYSRKLAVLGATALHPTGKEYSSIIPVYRWIMKGIEMYIGKTS